VGVCGYYLDHFVTDYSYWLSWFIVTPEYQGRHNGLVASKMLSHLIRQLKRLAVRKVFVATLGSDGRAVKFYLKHGFELEARLSDYYYRDEDQLILGKYL
jgi:ribosomal protein S18 acetylase RimI-like enzyme